MEAKKREVCRLLENNKLLVGDHEPRSALVTEPENRESSLSKKIPNFSDAFSIFGNNNFGGLEEGTRFETYEDYRDHKYRKRKERKSSRYDTKYVFRN